MPFIEGSVSIRCDIARAFQFLTQGENVPKVVPPEMKLRVVKCPDQLEQGSRLELQVNAYGPPQTIIYEIAECSAPVRLVEKQVKGPLKKYLHVHSLSTADDGTVLMTDRIEFEPPGGMMGFLVTEDRLRTALKSGMYFRQQAAKRLLEAS